MYILGSKLAVSVKSMKIILTFNMEIVPPQTCLFLMNLKKKRILSRVDFNTSLWKNVKTRKHWKFYYFVWLLMICIINK